MKRRSLFALLLTLSALAETGAADFYEKRVVSAPVVVTDILLLRPFGFALSAVGTALFIGTAPITLAANLAPPHDAFQRTANALIIGPGAFTFNRPLGELSYHANGVYPLRPGEPLGTGNPAPPLPPDGAPLRPTPPPKPSPKGTPPAPE